MKYTNIQWGSRKRGGRGWSEKKLNPGSYGRRGSGQLWKKAIKQRLGSVHWRKQQGGHCFSMSGEESTKVRAEVSVQWSEEWTWSKIHVCTDSVDNTLEKPGCRERRHGGGGGQCWGMHSNSTGDSIYWETWGGSRETWVWWNRVRVGSQVMLIALQG